MRRVNFARTVDAKALDVKMFLHQLSLAHAFMSICAFLAAKQAEKHRTFLIIHHRLFRILVLPSFAGGAGALAARQLRAHRRRPALISICGFFDAKQTEKQRTFLILHHRLPHGLVLPSSAGGARALAARQLRAHRRCQSSFREDVLASSSYTIMKSTH